MIDSGACGYGFRSNRWKKNWWSCARERDLLIEQWEDWLPAFAKAMRALSLRIRMLQQQRLQSNCYGDCTTDVLRSFESACASWDLLQQLQIIIIIIVAARPRREEEVQKRNLSELELSTKAFLMRWQGFIMAWLPRSELGMDCLQTCQLQVLFLSRKNICKVQGFLRSTNCSESLIQTNLLRSFCNRVCCNKHRNSFNKLTEVTGVWRIITLLALLWWWCWAGSGSMSMQELQNPNSQLHYGGHVEQAATGWWVWKNCKDVNLCAIDAWYTWAIWHAIRSCMLLLRDVLQTGQWQPVTTNNPPSSGLMMAIPTTRYSLSLSLSLSEIHSRMQNGWQSEDSELFMVANGLCMWTPENLLLVACFKGLPSAFFLFSKIIGTQLGYWWGVSYGQSSVAFNTTSQLLRRQFHAFFGWLGEGFTCLQCNLLSWG